MLDVFVDPYVLACPTVVASEEEIDQYVECLLGLRHLRKSGGVDFYVSANTLEVLEQAKSYPIGDRAQRFNHQQRRDVAGIMRRLLEGATIEERAAVEDLLVDNARCAPAEHVALRDTLFADQYHRIHAMVDLATIGEVRPVKNPCVFTRGLSSQEAIVRAEGSILVCIEESACPQLPYDYDVAVLNLDGPEALIGRMDPVVEWKAGRYEWALRVAVAQRSGHWPPTEDEERWKIGARFLESADEYGFLHDESKCRRLLGACVDTILGQNLRGVHVLRVGAGPNDAQRVRVRDGAKAWRRDVDDDFHLHYWKGCTGTELACLGPHDAFTIPE